jgi:hypothetical protein
VILTKESIGHVSIQFYDYSNTARHDTNTMSRDEAKSNTLTYSLVPPKVARLRKGTCAAVYSPVQSNEQKESRK